MIFSINPDVTGAVDSNGTLVLTDRSNRYKLTLSPEEFAKLRAWFDAATVSRGTP